MIHAHHSPAFAAVFARYTRWLLRRHFRAVRVCGSLPDTRAPLLVATQRVAWWDAMVLFHLTRQRLAGTHYAMMDAENLARLAFFRKLGAFGLVRGNPAGSLKYALERLREPNARVWVFPQGELAPADARPIACGRGGDWLASRAKVPVVPVAMRYEFGDERLPSAFVLFGEARMIERDGAVEAMVTATADRLSDDVHRARTDAYETVIRGRRSMSDRLTRRA